MGEDNITKKMEPEMATAGEEPSSEEAPVTTAGSPKPQTARSWLEHLSPEEAQSAMSFQDGPFLASFLTLAAASSSSRSHSLADGAQQPPLLFAASNKLDLTMAADLREVEATLGTYQKQFKDGSTELQLPVATKEAAAAAAPIADGDDHTTPTTEEEKESPKPEDPDELRIRSSGGTDDVPSKDSPHNTSLQPIPATTTTTTESNTIATTTTEHHEPKPEPTIASEDNVKPTSSETIIEETEKMEPVDKADATEGEETPQKTNDITTNTTTTTSDGNNSNKEESSSEKEKVKAATTREEEEEKPVEESPAVVAIENENPTITTTTTLQHDVGEEMSESVCAVFPSAADESSLSSNGSPCIPFVTLTPTFLKQKGTGNVVRALDSVLQIFSPTTSFLNPDDFLRAEWLLADGDEQLPSEDQMYLHRLKSVLSAAANDDENINNQDDKKNSSSVLLFLLLLIRIEVAVFMAFRDEQMTAKKKESGEEETSEQAQITTEKDCRLRSETLTGLLSRVESLDDLSKTIDADQLKDIMTPLIDAGFCSLSEDASKATTASDTPQLKNLLFAPLPILVQSLSQFRESDRPSFENWETAWKAALGNVNKHANASKPSAEDETKATVVSPAAEETKEKATEEQSSTSGNVVKSDPESTSTVDAVGQSGSSDWMDDNSPAVVTPTPTSSAKKKKKKSRRKKKKTSSSNVDSSGQPNCKSQASQTEVVAIETEEQEATVADEKPEAKDEDNSPEKTAEVSTPKKAEEPSPSNPTEAAKDEDTVETSDLKTNTSAASAPQSETAESTEAESKDEDVEVAQNSSFDSEKSPMSMSDDTASTRSESTKPDENDAADEAKASDKGDFSVSRVHGVGTVVVAPSATEEPSQLSNADSSYEGDSKNPGDSSTADDNHDEWETVEVKAKGSRKKGSQSGRHASGGNSQNGAKKSKSTRTSASRKRIIHRKIVKEILSSVLDSVDEEVKTRQQQKARNAKSSTPSIPAWQGARSIGQVGWAKKEAPIGTLRDVVVGIQAESTPKKTPQVAPKSAPAKQPASNSPSKPAEKGKSASSPGKRVKGQGVGADQNTASTIPETVSAESDARRIQPSSDRDVTRSESSSGGDSDDLQKQDRASKPVNSSKDASPAPPLPTLLSPGNANSSSSSVASSLEAPHASHGHHHTSPANENDVGYHLLDVCNRLTRDMDVFMARRATALNTRRNERHALLAALQDSVSSLWNGHSHVELYGSCATMLDLPSSDLDVVVLGLDHMQAAMATSSPQKSAVNGSPGDKASPDKTGADVPLPHHSMPPHYVPVHLNAERVVRLAAELERHPWAVHVKAIPTATVPVVKVLADPSRLPGMTPPIVGEEFVPLHQQMASPTPPAQAASAPSSDQSQSTTVGGSQPGVYQSEMAQPVWRGADVINGLLSLDITFEGPEHGGIGSTEFSARVVHDVCNETGLVPESTPFVQVIMVVKELLAQRRLNEPFSGGLSSYALLLLVLAVVCERKVIREELERVERQRRVVAAGVGNNAFSNVSVNDKSPSGNRNVPAATPNMSGGPGKTSLTVDDKKKGTGAQQQAANQPSKKNDKRAQAGIAQNQGNASQKPAASKPGQKAQAVSVQQSSPQAPSKKPSGGSWACIAKGGKTDSSATQHKTKIGSGATEKAEHKKAEPKKPSSFADAVARSQAKTPANAQASVQAKPSGATQTKAANAKKTNKKQPAQPAAKPGQANKNQPVKNTTQDAPKTGDKGPSVGAAQKDGATSISGKKIQSQSPRKIEADEETSKFNNYSSGVSADPSLSGNQSLFPQGFNDVIEVLCSGETTPGKLLMHFLLFYGQHYDAHATAIDISGKHHRDISMQNPPYIHLSPYIQRRTAGTIDPVTGMLTVDPIVVYDPLEGAENNNVARRCFLWSSVKWVFAQSYMTLSSAVEQNTTPPTTPGSKSEANAPAHRIANQGGQREAGNAAAWNGPYNPTDNGNLFDPSSPHPLLELLLSY